MQKIWQISMSKALIIVLLILYQTNSIDYPIYTSACADESATRLCAQKDNLTQYILSLKKGGTNILSTSDYDKNFFLCEEYTFDCGYVEDENQTVSIANGIQLKMNNTEVDTILPSNAALATNIKNYLNMTPDNAKIVMKSFPLTLTATQSDLFFTNYMNILLNQIKTKYASQKLTGTKVWADVNVNIRTAVTQVIKENSTQLYGSFWEDFKANNFTEMADYLKDKYNQVNKLYYLRSAYLIDSVSRRCNKYQSVNFLVDQSGSIGAPGFQLARDFLFQYISGTLDDPALMSVHFYDDAFQPYLDYGHTKAQLLSGVASKPYRAQGTLTGGAINQTIVKIQAANFEKGLNKVMIVMTDGFSYDDVLEASNYARSKGITMIAVGIGPNVNYDQMLEIAETQSNVIKVSSYADLQKLVNFIENFFCKQIIDIKLNDFITGNVVRVPDSPSYYRLERSPTTQVYQLKLTFDSDPDLKNMTAQISQFDPFPDEFSRYRFGQKYRISLNEIAYFVYPQQQQELRVKKKLFTVQNFQFAYLAMGGYNIRFNISLTKCSTVDCSLEKATYEVDGATNADTSAHSTSNDSDISNSVYATSCLLESQTRVCPQKGNLTEYLLSLKKGSTDILSLSDYNRNFFLCEEYGFDCGYVENDNETISIANGIELKMNASQIDTIIPGNASLAATLKQYLGLSAQDAKCGMKIYPLVLTASQSDLFLTNYLALLTTQIKTKYTSQKPPTSLTWPNININIKTAVLQMIKQNPSLMTNDFWTYFIANNFTLMSGYLKQLYQDNNEKGYCLRSAYLIDSVTGVCEKYQSVNFLVDQSGSIGVVNFNLVLGFLEEFVNVTNDDPKLMSVHFYDAAFDPYLGYNNTKAQLITGIKAKTYRAGGTYTGLGIKSAVDKILASNLQQGINKILIVITDGQSYDQVLTSAIYARSQQVTVIAIGVGAGVNDTQMLEIAQSSSNVIKVSSFSQLTKLSKYIGNFLCKQIIDLKYNQSSPGHSVKAPSSPTYFRVQKSPTSTYQLRIRYDKNPDLNNVSIYTSQYDPFPNELSEYSLPEAYKVSDTERVHYIYPVHQNQVRKKKSYFKVYEFGYEYVAVAGKDVRFNVTLGACSSTGCRAGAAAASRGVGEDGVKAGGTVVVEVKGLRTSDGVQQLQTQSLLTAQYQTKPTSTVSNTTIVLIAGCCTIVGIVIILVAIAYNKFYSSTFSSQQSTLTKPPNATEFDLQITSEAISNQNQSHQKEMQQIQEQQQIVTN